MRNCYLSRIVITFLLFLFPVLVSGSTLTTTSPLPTIRSFIDQVWQTNPGVLAAEAEVNAANANAAALSRPLYNPELEIDGEQVRDDEQDDTYTVGISQTIDLFNKRGANRQVGQSMLAETQAALAAQKLVVGIAALTALNEYNTAGKSVDLAKKRTKLLRKFVELIEKKYAAGDLGQATLDQAKLAFSEAIALQANTEIALIKAEEILTAITNHTASTWPILPSSLPSPPQLPSDPEKLLQQLPTIQVFNNRVNTANARIKVAKANTRPDPTIGLRGGQEDNKALIGLNFRIPIFVRNNFFDQVTSASQEALAFEKARLDAYWRSKARLHGTVSRYNVLYRSYKQWRNISTGSLNGGIKLLDKLWDAGEINTTDYLIQLKQRIDSQIAGTELQGQVWQAWFQWLDASGDLNFWLGCEA